MMSRQATWLTGLLLSAIAVLVAEPITARPNRPHAASFHRHVGGLGFGPALDLSECPLGVDPRLDGGCAYDRGPVPGGTCFCPRHAGVIFKYRRFLTSDR